MPPYVFTRLRWVNFCRQHFRIDKMYLYFLSFINSGGLKGRSINSHGLLATYSKLRVVHAPGMPGTFSTPPRVSDPDMHHGTFVTHVSWSMPGSLTSGGGENVSGILGACATHNVTYLARGPWHWPCSPEIFLMSYRMVTVKCIVIMYT